VERSVSRVVVEGKVFVSRKGTSCIRRNGRISEVSEEGEGIVARSSDSFERRAE
jgi:hypothetical protein